MEVIAETKDGYLIQASGSEIKEILNAVTGIRPSEISVGQKIPAIDYASTITKIKALREDHSFAQLLVMANRFNKEVAKLKAVAENANKIEV